MGDYSRRTVLLGAGGALATAVAGCSDEDEPAPGLHAVDVLTLYRPADSWYDYPEQVGVQVTVENTDVDRHQGTLLVRLTRAEVEQTRRKQRAVELPGGTTRAYRVVFDVEGAEAATFSAEARFAGQ